MSVLYLSAGAAAAALSDPTRPPDYGVSRVIIQQPEKRETEFNLTAIRIDEDFRSIILNGKLLKEGEKVNSAKVLEIHPSHVVLEHKNERLVVRLFEGLNKKTSSPDKQMEISN